MKLTQKSQDLNAFVDAVLTNKIEVGQIITQSELCAVLGMSMSPLRELLVLLEELELVESRHRSGFQIIYPDLDFMSENMQFRIMIEKYALDAFLETVESDWIAEQVRLHEQAIEKLEHAEDLRELNAYILDFDRDFHRFIVGALQNKAITKAHEYAQTKLRIARQVHRRVPPRKTNLIAKEDHLKILGAVQTRDAKAAAQALDEHFEHSIRNTMVGY